MHDKNRQKICRTSRSPKPGRTKAPTPFCGTRILSATSSGVSSRRSASRCSSWRLTGNFTKRTHSALALAFVGLSHDGSDDSLHDARRAFRRHFQPEKNHPGHDARAGGGEPVADAVVVFRVERGLDLCLPHCHRRGADFSLAGERGVRDEPRAAKPICARRHVQQRRVSTFLRPRPDGVRRGRRPDAARARNTARRGRSMR